jgi:hypothetical protein
MIGTETGQLFAAKVEGPRDELTDLTASLSHRIADTITAQATSLVAAVRESKAERLDHIVKSVKDTNRPAVSVSILLASDHSYHCETAETELGAILLKAGFPVLDSNSDRKPELEITGVEVVSPSPRRRASFSCRATLDLKVQERRSGNIIALDHQESDATDVTRVGANHLAQVEAVDRLAERILPLLAQ